MGGVHAPRSDVRGGEIGLDALSCYTAEIGSGKGSAAHNQYVCQYSGIVSE
jgi:hypothetical protein